MFEGFGSFGLTEYFGVFPFVGVVFLCKCSEVDGCFSLGGVVANFEELWWVFNGSVVVDWV